MFRSYINYLKIESEQVKRFHSALWAGVFTGVFACLYLYVFYNITPPMPYKAGFENKTEYSRKDANQYVYQDSISALNNNNNSTNTQDTIQSPFSALKSFWHEAVNGVSNLKTK